MGDEWGTSLQVELFADELRRLMSEPGHRPASWTDAEIRHFYLVAQCAEAAQTSGDLHALQVLRLRIRPDEEPGTSSVQLSLARRLIITFKADSIPMTAVFDIVGSETEDPT